MDIRLYDQGHEVFGVEISEIAIKEFFEESNLPYTVEAVSSINGKVYKVVLIFYIIQYLKYCVHFVYLWLGVHILIKLLLNLLVKYFIYLQSLDGRLNLYACDFFSFSKYVIASYV